MKKQKEFMDKLRAMSIDELEKELVQISAQMFHLRSLVAAGQQIKTHFFGDYRKQIARIQTVLNEKRGK